MRPLVAALAIGYFVLLVANTCFFAAGTDSSGYLNHARLLARGQTSVEIAGLHRLGLDSSHSFLFTPYGFARGPAGRMVPTYPVGLPLHLAAAALIGGWRLAPFLVSPALAMGCLVLVFLIAREIGVPKAWAIAGAAVLAAFPVFILHALQPMSDVAATFWTMLAIWLALRDRSVACGIAFGTAVAVRPTNILLAIPLFVALLHRPRSLLRTAAAALPFGLALLAYQWHLYGSPWRTGYGGAGDVISFLALPPCFSFHVTSLASIMTPLVMPLALVFVFDRTMSARHRALLVAWFAVFFAFYSFYSYCPGWASSRFLIPAVPALIIGALRMAARVPRAIAIAAVTIVIGWEVRQIGSLHALHVDDWDSIFPRTVAWVERTVPRDATVLSNHFSGVFYFHSGRVTPRWDQLDPATTALLRSRDGGRPWFAVVSKDEGGREELMRHAPGEWVEAGSLRDVTLYRLP